MVGYGTRLPGYLDTSCSPTTTWNLETLVWQWAAVRTVSEESRVPPQNGVERPLLGREYSSRTVLNNSPTLMFEIMILCLPDEPHLPGELIPAGLVQGYQRNYDIKK